MIGEVRTIMPGLSYIGKMLMLMGVTLVVVGAIVFAMSKWSGGWRLLPGDIVYRRGNFVFVFPIATSIIISILLTLLLSLWALLRR